jgi:prophage DNA circulation protein
VTKRTTARALAILVSSAVLLAACGGDGGDNPAEEETLTREQYIERADAICRTAAEDFENLDRPQSAEELEPFVDQARDRTEALISDLRDLEPPDEISDEVDTILTNLESAVDRFPDLLEAADDQDVEAIQRINAEIQQEVDAANEAAQEIGLQDCGDTGPTS